MKGAFEQCCSNPCRTRGRNPPVRLIVPYPAGGTADVLFRILAERLQNKLGQPIVQCSGRGSTGEVPPTPRGRPGRWLDFQRQYDRKPARCQRITVSGRMMASASRVFGNNPQTQPRTNLSLAENGNRPTLPRRSTMICCRSTRISAFSVARDRNRSRTRQKISLMRPNIRASVTRFCTPRQPDSIYDSDNYLSSTLLQGQAQRSGSIRRIPATEVEALVTRSVPDHLEPTEPIDDQSLASRRLR
jgi:hypothetical protein